MLGVTLKTTCFLMLMFAFGCRATRGQSVPLPNIVFILVDDLGYSDVGYMNHKPGIQTPNIDQLAKNGLVFTQAYAAAPVCSPTRASILTGKSPAALKSTCHIPGRGMKGYLERQNKDHRLKEAFFLEHLPLEEITIAEVLKGHGYTTGFIGKWHLAGAGSAFSKSEGIIDAQFHPEHQGFDTNIGGCAYGQPASWFAPYHNAAIPDKTKGEYLTDRLGDEAVNFIQQNEERPFFLYLSTYTVHTPLKAPQETIDKYNGNTYFAMIEKLDENVGKVVEQLKQSNLLDNTMVIFYSDNGGLWGNAPLKGNKGSLHEGGIRVPLIVSFPGKIEPRQSSTPVTSVDLFPTIMESTRISTESLASLEGVSLWPLLTGGKQIPDRPLYWHFPHYRKDGRTMGAALREGDWKLIWAFEADSTYLYNLKEDLGESLNLATIHPEREKEMLAKLMNWQKATDAEMPIVGQ